MSWDLALPLLVCLATFLCMGWIYWAAKKMLMDPRAEEGVDAGSRGSSH